MQTTPHIGLETESIVIFSLLAIAGLLIDLFAHRADKPISVKAAAMWSIFWIAVGSLFGAFLWYHFSKEVASLYFAGYAFEIPNHENTAMMAKRLYPQSFILGSFRRCCFQTHLCFNWNRALLIRSLCGDYLRDYGCFICNLNDEEKREHWHF